ncbi:MAG: glycosyltransferase family 4 protein [Pyrinomonadaceae bacterium]
MRILVGMPDKNSLGGPIYCEPPFVAALRDAGVEVDEEVYVYGDSGTAASLLSRVSRVLGAARRLRARTREKQYDVVHLNTSIDEKCVLRDIVTMHFLRKSSVPVHLKMHGSIASFLRTKNVFWRYLLRRLFAMAANIGVLSREERESFLAAGCPAEKLSDAKYVVIAEDFKRDPQFRERNAIDDAAPILLFSARFIPAKGLLDLIDACGELKQAGRDFVLFCLGDGPVRAEAEARVGEIGLTKEIRFTGYIAESETAAYHANSTIFVFPTYHDEGFPLVLLKSIAAGMPIITTRIRAAADYLNEPDNCLWVSPRNSYDLAEKITRLLADDALRSSMSANNRRLAEQFSPANIAREYQELYKGIVQKEVRP